MPKFIKKAILVLVTIFLFFACSKKKYEDEAVNYLNKLINYTVREKNTNNTTDNKEFDEFLDKVFLEMMESDYMNMHYSVVDYKSFNIEKPPVDLGEVEYGMNTNDFKYMENQLDELLSFDYDSLSYRQQYDFEALEYSIYETLTSMCFYKYDFLYKKGDCIIENLISNFTDFSFYDQESIDDYLTCLKDIERFINDTLTYTSKQADDGYPLLDEWIDYSIDVVDGMIEKTDNNELIVSFDKRINDLDFINKAQKDEYIKENKQIVLDSVIPAYAKVSEELEKYRGKAKVNDYPLYKLNKDYARFLYCLKGSNNQDIDVIWQDLKDNLYELEAELATCVYNEDSFAKFNDFYYNDLGALGLSGKDALEYLRNNLNVYYPELENVEYSVEELDPSTAPDTVIAYYWPAPVDNVNQNIIRTNPNNMGEGLDTYSTLAHEGFPGHLYQHIYYQQTNPHNFRSTISFIGYSEGYAVEASYNALRFCGINDDFAAAALFFETNYYFIAYSIIDIGVNYYGWTTKDIIKFFNENTLTFEFDEESAASMRELLIEMPGVYCSYGIGLSSFMNLSRYAQRELGNKYDEVEYQKTILKNGPLPFNILEKAVDEYIDNNY